MRIAFLVFGIDGLGGTERSVVTQANALVAAGHQVSVVSAVRREPEPHYAIDPAVEVEYLVDLSDPDAPRATGIDDDLAARLADCPSILVPERWDLQFSALTDAGFQGRLPTLDVDVVVTVTPGTAGGRGPAAARWPGRRAPGAPGVLRPYVGPRAAPDLRSAGRRGRPAHPEHGRLAHHHARASRPDDGGRAQPAAVRLQAPVHARHEAHRERRPPGRREGLPQADPGLRRGRRPDARLAAADPRHRRHAARAHPPDPQDGSLRPGRAAGPEQGHAERVGPREHLGADLEERGPAAGRPGGDGRRRSRRGVRRALRRPRAHPPRGRRPAGRARLGLGHGHRAAPTGDRRRAAAPTGRRRPGGIAGRSHPTSSPSAGSRSSRPPSTGAPEVRAAG